MNKIITIVFILLVSSYIIEPRAQHIKLIKRYEPNYSIDNFIIEYIVPRRDLRSLQAPRSHERTRKCNYFVKSCFESILK